MPPVAHKPRHRNRLTRSHSIALPARPFPLSSILHPLRSTSTQWLVLPTLLMTVFLFRWAVGLGPYSGKGVPPMYGDFEAQRHWMEITNHLPLLEWYWYDHAWWGLDYPPLTGFHSWVCGWMSCSGSMIDPSWFALQTSRGMEDENLKVFMRATVALSDYLTFIPAAVLYVRYFGRHVGVDKYDQSVILAAILMQPANIIIDYGHFQYNSVMLGFTLLALSNFLANRLLWGSLLFVLALGFKQMALYYAPAIFAYLLGLCVQINGPTRIFINFQQLILLGITVVVGFTILLAPFAIWHGEEYTATEQLLQVVHRVFPFARGLWEDKVANFWCATNVVIKYREHFENTLLQKASLGLTLLSILPPCGLLFMKPQKRLLAWGVAGCAWGFFLFSFQVHEKSVLLPLMPTTIVLAGGLTEDTKAWVGWINNIAMFSMWYLLRRDGLALQYIVLIFLWTYLLGLHQLPSSNIAKAIHLTTYAGAIALHLAELFIENEWTRRYQDIWIVGNVMLSFASFSVAYLWVMWRMVDESGILDEVEEKESAKKVQ